MKKSNEETVKTLEENIKHYDKLAFEYELMKGLFDEETILELEKANQEIKSSNDSKTKSNT